MLTATDGTIGADTILITTTGTDLSILLVTSTMVTDTVTTIAGTTTGTTVTTVGTTNSFRLIKI